MLIVSLALMITLCFNDTHIDFLNLRNEYNFLSFAFSRLITL